MSQSNLELRPLRVEDEHSFVAATQEFRREGTWEFALGYKDAMSFGEYVRKLARWSRGEALPPGYVPASFLVGVVDGEVVGRVSLRHVLNDYLTNIGGHIGYGVRPSQRRRGYATAMLRQALPLAAAVGIPRALLTCDVVNLASKTVIERCGGVLENVTNDPSLPVQKLRYWIACPP